MKSEQEIKEILEKIKKRIKPDESVLLKIDKTVKEINEILTGMKIKAECVKGGSIAKGTFLKNDHDVDLFVRFDKSYDNNKLSDILEKVLKKFKPERVHGSRDYFQFKKDGLNYEIIPVFNVNNYKEAANVTDMSPLHVFWVKKFTEKNPELKDEIRLTKQFCKGITVYGAESYIKGFSGHIIDILIIFHGSFLNLLRNASKWESKVVLDSENHLKKPLEELNISKIYSPLVIVDPIQPDRNAAAAVDKEKFNLFKQKSREFLENPSEKFFEIKKFNIKDLEKKKDKEKEVIILEVTPLKGKADVIGSKLLKVFVFLKNNIKYNDFKILEYDWQFDKEGKEKTLIYFVIKKEKLSDFITRLGPPLNQKEDYEKFKAKHKETFVKNNRIYAKLKRKYMNINDLTKDLIKNKYVKDRVKKIKIKQ